MKEINDNELDNLIKESVQRQVMQEIIQQNVMKEIETAKQRAVWMRALRLVGFSFGLPVLLLLCLMSVYRIIVSCNYDKTLLIVMAVFVGLVVYSCNSLLKNFSFNKV